MKRFELIRLLSDGDPDDEIYIHGAARAATEASDALFEADTSEMENHWKAALQAAVDAEPVAVEGVGEADGKVVIF